MSKRRKKICARLAFSNPSVNEDHFTSLAKKTIVQNLRQISETDRSRYVPTLSQFITDDWLDHNLLLDYWYVDFENMSLGPAKQHPTAKSKYILPDLYEFDWKTVNPDGQSVVEGQTPGKDRLLRNQPAPYVFMMIYITNYLPSTGIHGTHYICAFKKNDVLYCFNPWGKTALDFNTPDDLIWHKLRRKYGCNRLFVYHGPNLQENDRVGACGVLSFTFGTHMYIDTILKLVGLHHVNNRERFDTTVQRLFNVYQPAFGPVLRGLQLPHMQNKLTSLCWNSFQVCVDEKKQMTVERNTSKRKGAAVRMQTNGPRPRRTLTRPR